MKANGFFGFDFERKTERQTERQKVRCLKSTANIYRNNGFL